MERKNYKLKTNLKKIANVLMPGDIYTDQHFYKMHNMCKKMSVEGAALQLLGAMPLQQKLYEIEAFLDFGDHAVAYSSWDMIGGSEPDHYIVNGRELSKTWDGRPYLRPSYVNKDKYPIHKLSLKRGNIVMHVYTSR